MDKELQSRSGLNIGIESTLLPFVQAGAAEVTVIPATGAEVVLVEHTDQAARVPMVCGMSPTSSNIGGGYVWDTDAAAPAGDVNFYFVDELGNEIQVANNITTPFSPNVPTPIGDHNGTFENFTFFCLAPGEKITAKFVASAAPPA